MFTRRRVLAAASAPFALPVIAQAAGDPPPVSGPPTVEELLRPPAVIDTALSPDGNLYAVLREQRSGDKRVAYIVLNKPGSNEEPRRVILGDYEVYAVEWANNERLLFWINYTKDEKGRPFGLNYYGEFFPLPRRRIASIDLNGGGLVVLFATGESSVRNDYDLATIVDYMETDPRRILMQVWDYRGDVWALHKVDVYTGETELLERGVSHTYGWWTQGGVPMLRFDTATFSSAVNVMARAPGEKDWKLFRKFRRNELKKLDEFDIMAATPEAGVLLVANGLPGEPTIRIRKFDIRTLEYGEVVASHEGRDMSGVVGDEALNLVASSFYEDRLNYVFTDPELGAHFKGINTFLGKECNVRIHDINLDHDRFIVHVTGPRQPGAFHIYNRKNHDLEPIGRQRPWLSEDRLAGIETLAVKTRDGAEITAYLTVPPGAAVGPRPMVVMPHGGPHHVRDYYDFDVFAQSLAARGWLVLQPNFRGSGGYGRAFEEAGYRHWVDRMQEDLEDAVALMTSQGRADPKRIAICGASYGGYAALMGAVRQPTLYRAAVSIAGPSDLDAMLDFERQDGADSPTYRFWARTIGDPKTDAEMIKHASPALRAGELTAPVLLIHGTEDDVVPIKQSKIMQKALKTAGRDPQYVELKGESHGGWTPATWKTVLEKTGEFIAKNL